MVIALVGATVWGTTKTWPAGTQAGHLAVFQSQPLLAAWSYPSSDVPGWVSHGYSGDRWAFLWATPTGCRVWSKVLTAADVAAPPPAFSGQVTVYSGTSGVLNVSTSRYAAIPAGGGIVVTALDRAPISGGGVTWNSPQGSYSGYSVRSGWWTTPTDAWANLDATPGTLLTLILDTPKAPLKPVWVAPNTGSEVASGSPIAFTWQHRPTVAGGTQGAYKLEVRTAADGTRFWTGSAWSTSEVWVTSGSESVTIPAPALTADQTMTVRVWTRELADGLDSPASAPLTVTPVTPPTVTVTGPASPVTNDMSPTFTWTRATPRGVQTAYRVWVVDSLGQRVPGVDSGVQQGSATSWTAPPVTGWVRGETYTVWVEVWQTGGSSSSDDRPFVMTWTPPATPTVTATPLPTGGHQVDVSGLSAGSVVVERLKDTGDWVQILTAPIQSGTVRLVDVMATWGVPTRWRAQQSTALEGVGMVSDWGDSGLVTSQDPDTYIADALDPSQTWLKIRIRSDDVRTRYQVMQVDHPIGSDLATSIRGPQQGLVGTFTFACQSRAEVAALDALWSTALDLVVRGWPERPYREWTPEPMAAVWVTPSAPYSEARLDQTALSGRDIPMPWVEQDPPELGVSQAPITHPIEWL